MTVLPLAAERLTHLQRLEAESIHIMREVVAEATRPVMLYSVGKDSAVMLHLARKAFYPSPPPFPLLHVDTTWKFKAMYELRDRMAEALASTSDPFLALRRLAASYVRFAARHPVQYRLLLMRGASPQADSAQRRAADTVLRYMVDATRPCVLAGALHGDPEDLALRLWTAVHGCAALMISQPQLPWPADVDKLAEDIARMAGLGVAVASRLSDGTRPTPQLVAALDKLPALFDDRAGTR